MKSMKVNMLSSLLCKVVTLITGLVVQRYILLAYGSTYNGLTSLITQIMSYLVLLEAGLGTASTQAFYKPLNDGDWDKISGIMKATAISYRRVAYMFMALLVGGALLVPISAHGDIDFTIAALLTLVSGASHIFTYMFSGKYAAFLSAERKMYVRYALTIITTLTSAVLRIIALKQGAGILTVQSIHLLCTLISCFAITFYVIKKYPQIKRNVIPDFTSIKKRWNVLIHQIAGLVVNHTDIVILSFASTLRQVSVYSTYNMIYGQLGTVVQSTFVQAPQGDFGRLYAKDKNAFERVYAMYETLLTVLLFVISTAALIMTLPFIKLYTAGITDVVYVDVWLPVLFVAIFLMNHIRTPMLLTINISGRFKETQNGAILEMIINLVVSIALFAFTDLGMHALLIGTVVSFIYRSVDVIVYTYKNILERSILKFVRLVSVNALAMGLLVFAFYVYRPIVATSFLQWMLYALIVCVVVAVVYVLFNLIFNFKETKVVLGGIKRKFKPSTK